MLAHRHITCLAKINFSTIIEKGNSEAIATPQTPIAPSPLLFHFHPLSPQYHDFYWPDLRFFRVFEARTSGMVHRREIFHKNNVWITTPCPRTTCQLPGSTTLSKYSCKCWCSRLCISVFLSSSIHRRIRTTKPLLLYKSHNTSISLECQPNKRIFRRVFIFPAEPQRAFTQSRKFVALDGTHLKGFFQQTLLLAAGIDANGQCITYAWAVV